MTNSLSVERERLNSLFGRIDEFDEDKELQSHWVKYLCVLSNGHIENSIRYIYSQYAEKRSNENIAKYINSNLRRFQNANTERILTLISAFSKDWRDEIDKFITDEMKKSIDNIVTNKNAIAHGRSVGITSSLLRKYWVNSIKVLEFIEEQTKRNR